MLVSSPPMLKSSLQFLHIYDITVGEDDFANNIPHFLINCKYGRAVSKAEALPIVVLDNMHPEHMRGDFSDSPYGPNTDFLFKLLLKCAWVICKRYEI